jgi:hypothetical protein
MSLIMMTSSMKLMYVSCKPLARVSAWSGPILAKAPEGEPTKSAEQIVGAKPTAPIAPAPEPPKVEYITVVALRQKTAKIVCAELGPRHGQARARSFVAVYALVVIMTSPGAPAPETSTITKNKFDATAGAPGGTQAQGLQAQAPAEADRQSELFHRIFLRIQRPLALPPVMRCVDLWERELADIHVVSRLICSQADSNKVAYF